MNPVLSGAAGVGLLAAVGAAAVGVGGDGSVQPVEDLPERSVYRVVAAAGDATCSVTKGRTLSPGLSELEAEPGCDRLLAGMGSVRYWGESDDGLVTFSGNGIDPVATFSIGDGFAYESITPREPFLALSASE